MLNANGLPSYTPVVGTPKLRHCLGVLRKGQYCNKLFLSADAGTRFCPACRARRLANVETQFAPIEEKIGDLPALSRYNLLNEPDTREHEYSHEHANGENRSAYPSQDD
jgi:hypothetical protein